MTNDMLADVISAIMEAADEVKKKADQDDQDYGQLLAYAETLSIIQDACTADEQKEIGLDFDIDLL